MVHCTCGKAIEKIPDWLATVNVEFVCNNCPNRQTMSIALISLEPSMPERAKFDDEESEETPDDVIAED